MMEAGATDLFVKAKVKDKDPLVSLGLSQEGWGASKDTGGLSHEPVFKAE